MFIIKMMIEIVIILTDAPFVVIIDAVITIPPTAGKITEVTFKKLKQSVKRTNLKFCLFFLVL